MSTWKSSHNSPRELRLWVLDNFEGYRIRQLAGIPEIEYSGKKRGLWSALWRQRYPDVQKHQERKKIREQVEIARVLTPYTG